MKSEEEILKCGMAGVYFIWWKMIIMIPTFAAANETLKCNISNEICGMVLLFVFSQSEEVRLRKQVEFYQEPMTYLGPVVQSTIKLILD